MKKRCGMCGRYKSLEHFNKDGKRCRPCKSDYYQARKLSTYEDYIVTVVYARGLTRLQYEDILFRQENKCAICKDPPEVQKKRLHLDHCHKTGKVRGVLCTRCNTALGSFRDNVDLLEVAISYLKQFQS